MGTKERLAVALEVSVADLDAYLAGEKPLPNRAFIAAVDVVANGERKSSKG